MSANTVGTIYGTYTDKINKEALYKIIRKICGRFYDQDENSILLKIPESIKSHITIAIDVRLFIIEEKEKGQICIFSSYFDGIMIPYIKLILSYYGGDLIEYDNVEYPVRINVECTREYYITPAISFEREIIELLKYKFTLNEIYKIIDYRDIVLKALKIFN